MRANHLQRRAYPGRSLVQRARHIAHFKVIDETRGSLRIVSASRGRPAARRNHSTGKQRRSESGGSRQADLPKARAMGEFAASERTQLDRISLGPAAEPGTIEQSAMLGVASCHPT
jgi:hypothetical protein